MTQANIEFLSQMAEQYVLGKAGIDMRNDLLHLFIRNRSFGMTMQLKKRLERFKQLLHRAEMSDD
ncbi:hypothetical protein D3C78_1166730 [compost metagenome]